jgi:glutaredoxin
MNKILVVYTLKGCGWCTDFKKMLKDNKIPFKNRDVEKHKEEHDLFVQAKNDFVPSFMIVDPEKESAELFAPDIDFDGLENALEIIKEKL